MYLSPVLRGLKSTKYPLRMNIRNNHHATTRNPKEPIIQAPENRTEILALALSVYHGLSETDINEIEQIALDRHYFFSQSE